MAGWSEASVWRATRSASTPRICLRPILALAPLVGAAMENARLYASLDDSNRALNVVNQELESFSYSVSHDLTCAVAQYFGIQRGHS